MRIRAQLWLKYLLIFVILTVVSWMYSQCRQENKIKRYGTAREDRFVENVNNSKPAQFECRKIGEEMKSLKFHDLELNETCQSCLSDKKIGWTMVIFVKSAVGNFARRQLLRRTWASVRYIEGGRFFTVFIVGRGQGRSKTLLEEEIKQNNDILQFNVTEDYRNVGLKTLAGMQWASENLPDEYFYSSADDDVMINIGEVRKTVDKFRTISTNQEWAEFPLVCMYGLRGGSSSKPIRKSKNKNFISKDEYRWPFWPRFCLGAMYTTSVSVIRQLWRLSCNRKPLQNDDVWITGVLRQQLEMPDQMTIQIDPPVVRHYRNFKPKKFKMSDWLSLYDKFKHSSICKC